MTHPMDEQIRFATYLSLVRRGMDPEDPTGMALGHALHPFDTDGPVPPRALEKDVRRRSRSLARRSREMPLDQIMEASLEALHRYGECAAIGSISRGWPEGWHDYFAAIERHYKLLSRVYSDRHGGRQASA